MVSSLLLELVVPTAGLGLGLPGLQPGLADKMQMAEAVAESDAAADIQRAMKQSEQEFKESEDDELQRALKMSRMSADSVSCTLRCFTWVMVFPLRVLSSVFHLCIS